MVGALAQVATQDLPVGPEGARQQSVGVHCCQPSSTSVLRPGTFLMRRGSTTSPQSPVLPARRTAVSVHRRLHDHGRRTEASQIQVRCSCTGCSARSTWLVAPTCRIQADSAIDVGVVDHLWHRPWWGVTELIPDHGAIRTNACVGLRPYTRPAAYRTLTWQLVDLYRYGHNVGPD